MNFTKFSVVVSAAVVAVIVPLTAQASSPDRPAAETDGVQVSAPAVTSNATDAPRGEGINRVGVPVRINDPDAILFMCPMTSCGGMSADEGWPRADVSDICYIPATWGFEWHLVMNHANNSVGFISFFSLDDIGYGFSTTIC